MVHERECDLLERMTITYRGTRAYSVGDVQLRQKLTSLSECAALYFGGSYPGWSPKYLIKRVLRKVAWPFLRFQVCFNREIAQALLELDAKGQTHAIGVARYQGTLTRLIELEQTVKRLTAEVEALTHPGGGDGSKA